MFILFSIGSREGYAMTGPGAGWDHKPQHPDITLQQSQPSMSLASQGTMQMQPPLQQHPGGAQISAPAAPPPAPPAPPVPPPNLTQVSYLAVHIFIKPI